MLIERIFQLRHRLVFRLILAVGFTLLVCIATWAYFNIDYQESKLTENIVVGTDRLTNTIKLGTHYAMMLNSRDDINQIITNIGKLKEIQNIRIYNKQGQIKYSNHRAEVDTTTNIKAEACDICHRTEPPLVELASSGKNAAVRFRQRLPAAGNHQPHLQRAGMRHRRMPRSPGRQEGSGGPGCGGVAPGNRPGNSAGQKGDGRPGRFCLPADFQHRRHPGASDSSIARCSN